MMQTYLITMGDGTARIRFRGYEVSFPNYREARFFQRVADQAITDRGPIPIQDEFKDIGSKVAAL